MKKLTAFLLILAMLSTFAACGKENMKTGSSDAEKQETATETVAATVLDLGYPVTTDTLELMVYGYAFADVLINRMDKTAYMPIDDSDDSYWLYDDESNPYRAEDGRIMLMLAFTQKNIGKEAIGFVDEYAMKVVYGDGYEFEASAGGHQEDDGSFTGFSFDKMEPLSDEVPCRVVFDLPISVYEDESAPLSLVISIDGADYEYIIR